MQKSFLFFCSLLFPLLVDGQSSIWQELKKKYPDESGIFLYRDKVITLEVKNDSLVASIAGGITVTFNATAQP